MNNELICNDQQNADIEQISSFKTILFAIPVALVFLFSSIAIGIRNLNFLSFFKRATNTKNPTHG